MLTTALTRTLQNAASSAAGAADAGGQAAVPSKLHAAAAAAVATTSWTHDVAFAEQQWKDMQTWAEVLDSEGPLELDALCWFYLDPSVSLTSSLFSTSGRLFYACMRS